MVALNLRSSCADSLTMIRKADRRDARQLSEIAERTFRDTFSSRTASSDMDSHCRTSYSELIQAGELENPDMLTLFSERDGAVAGYAQLRWGTAPACVAAESPGEIHRLYVIPEWHGRGVAQALMDACIDEMKGRGSDVVWLGVWEHNQRALAFYRKCGFTEAGDHTFLLGQDPQRDLVMVQSVPDFARAADAR